MNYELCHHGIKGQQWGIRRGPPYPIETGMRKGSVVATVSRDPDPDRNKTSKKLLYTYNPKDPWDSKIYKGPFSVFKTFKTADSMYSVINQFKDAGIAAATVINEHKYEVVKDLKMPTKKQRIDDFIQLYEKKGLASVTYRGELKKMYDLMKQYGIKTSSDFSSLSIDNKPKSENDYKALYEIFNHAMEAWDVFTMTKDYVKIMSTKYDAMVDDNNQGIYNKAHDPVIIFNADDKLKTISTSKIPMWVMEKNYSDVKKKLAKSGEEVAL